MVSSLWDKCYYGIKINSWNDKPLKDGNVLQKLKGFKDFKTRVL
jgi:hypothetical protein